MYLYHATIKANEESITHNGLRCDCKPNWEGMSMTNAVYLAVNPDVSIDYVESSDSYDGSEVVVFQVDVEELDQKLLVYDENNRCEYVDDINSVAYLENISVNKLEKADMDANQNIHDFAQYEFYKRVVNERR